MGALTNLANWAVVLTTLAVISIIIGLHYEVLRGCIRFLPTLSHHRRRRVVILILVILVTHAVEVWIFALGYLFLLQWDTFGSVGGQTAVAGLLDLVYYSGMVYTTVGFGDIVPSGPIRFMTGMEALTGLVMITWSASFTFLEMQRDWRDLRQ
ncbi:MAG: potassium channel family protein [Gammaproteobacteria bacterium]|nr:potassium channel family protein [Gammaproteobacteria bacterium]